MSKIPWSMVSNKDLKIILIQLCIKASLSQLFRNTVGQIKVLIAVLMASFYLYHGYICGVWFYYHYQVVWASQTGCLLHGRWWSFDARCIFVADSGSQSRRHNKDSSLQTNQPITTFKKTVYPGRHCLTDLIETLTSICLELNGNLDWMW